MAAANFNPFVEQLLGLEGGVSDRPLSADPGGLTAKGVTQAVYDQWRGLRSLPTKSVREITRQEMVAITKANYWQPIQGDKLPSGVDFAVADYAFNSGCGQAVKDLQRVLGCAADGIVGLATLEALAVADLVQVVNDLCDRRWAFMKRLKNFKANQNGWRNRVAHVREQSLALVTGGRADAPSEALGLMDMAKAPPAPPTPAKKSATVWAAITGAVAMIVTTIKETVEQVPDVVRAVLPMASEFAAKSDLAKVIVNGLGAAGTLAAAYVAWSVIKNKRKES